MPLINRSFRRRDSAATQKRSFILSKLNIILLLILVISSIIFYVLYVSDILKIKEIAISPNQTFCSSDSEIRNFINLGGKNILFADPAWVNRKIAQRFNCIENAELKKTYPNKLTINLSQRQAASLVKVIKVDNSLPKLDLSEATPSSQAAKTPNLDFEVNESSVSSMLLVDKAGFILQKVDVGSFSNLPVIFLLNRDTTFDKLIPNEFIPNTLKTLEKMKNLSKSVRLLKIAESNLYISSEEKIVLSLTKDIMRQLASLQLILQKAKIESKQVEIIDLRFDKPVVIYSPKKN